MNCPDCDEEMEAPKEIQSVTYYICPKCGEECETEDGARIHCMSEVEYAQYLVENRRVI